jgi:cytoskeletal protein CcmA (bactofilin family)
MKPGESSTVIGPLTKIRGEISGTEDLLVDGEVEGVIRLEGACLTVRPEGRVKATILAQDVVVLGYVEGEIRAVGLVHLRGSAVVQGDVFAARLSIEDGATLRGNADPSKASEPLPGGRQQSIGGHGGNLEHATSQA